MIRKIDRPDGTIEYFDSRTKFNHREDGPAIIYSNGIKLWLKQGWRHRLDGPAVECPLIDNEWWIEGNYIPVKSQEEFERYLRLIAFQ